jgi:hypothetical protein
MAGPPVPAIILGKEGKSKVRKMGVKTQEQAGGRWKVGVGEMIVSEVRLGVGPMRKSCKQVDYTRVWSGI